MKRIDIIKNGEIAYSSGEDDFTTEAEVDTWFADCQASDAFGSDWTFAEVALDDNYDYKVRQVHRKRRAEYPSLADQLDADYWARHGDMARRDAIDAQIAAVKAKYPLPVP